MRPLIDAHLDISWNACHYDRDQTLPLAEMRAREAGMTGKSRGNCTVSLPEMRAANIGVCLATILCRALPETTPELDDNIGAIAARGHGEVILREDLDYCNQTVACAQGQAQMAYYRLLEQEGELRELRTAADLNAHWKDWLANPDTCPIGYILSMEGADPILDPGQAAWWFEQGLRTVCLAHYGPSAYAMGTGGDGPLTDGGREMLIEFARLGIVLDLVHTADVAFAQALEIYEGPVFISHGNCRSLVPHDRQISDEQLKQVAARGGVIGAVLDNWMLVPGYLKNPGDKQKPQLAAVADHMDHVAQVTGSSEHVAIGSDLDGGFGHEQTPEDFTSIAHLHRLDEILCKRGWTGEQIEGVFCGNWLRFFEKALPT